MRWPVWMIATLLLIAGCVAVTVQMGERNAIEREIGVNRDKDKDKEQRP